MAGYAYPYDPTALAVSNKVGPEQHTLSDYTNAWRCIVPLGAPFFRHTLVVKHVGTGRILKEGLDFYLGYYFEDGSTVTKMPLYGSIFIIDAALTGRIEFTLYQSLGGAFTITHAEAVAFLSRKDLADPRNVDWAELMRIPRLVDPIDAPNTLPEALATDLVAAAINRLGTAIAALSTAEQTKYAPVITAITTLTARITAHQLELHRYTGGAHNVTYSQLGALGKNAAAANTLKAYGKTVNELTALVNSMGTTATLTDLYYKLTGGAFSGKLGFSETTIESTNGTVKVSIGGDNVGITATDAITITADSDKNSTKIGAALQSGHNGLSVHSTGIAASDAGAVYNGQRLIHAGNIAAYVKDATPGAGPKFDLKVSNTAYGTLWGKGTAAFPLTGSFTYPAATDTVLGLVSLNSDMTSTSSTTVPNGTAMTAAEAEVNKYVPGSYTVNGHPLTADVTVNVTDLGLNNVNNTAANAKPPSNAFIAAVGTLAAVGHTHPYTDLLTVPTATDSIPGLAKLDNTLSTATNTAATAALVKTVADSVMSVESTLDGKIPNDILNVIRYSDNDAVVDSVSTFSINMKAGLRFFIGDGPVLILPATTLNLATLFPTGYKSKVFYFYVTFDGTTVSYAVRTTRDVDTDTSTYIGYCNTNATTISGYSFTEVVRILNIGELAEHIASTTAHGLGNKTLAQIFHLDLMKNYGVTNDIITTDPGYLAGSTLYITEQALRGVVDEMYSHVTITEGLVADGATIPLPVGFTYGQCAIILTPANLSNTVIKSPIVALYLSETNGVAMVKITLANGTTVSGTAKYYIVANKEPNFSTVVDSATGQYPAGSMIGNIKIG